MECWKVWQDTFSAWYELYVEATLQSNLAVFSERIVTVSCCKLRQKPRCGTEADE